MTPSQDYVSKISRGGGAGGYVVRVTGPPSKIFSFGSKLAKWEIIISAN